MAIDYPAIARPKHPYHIAIVDDVAATAQHFAQELSLLFEGVTVMTPNQATGTLTSGGFDAIVTDLRFLGNHRVDNGIELIQGAGEGCPPVVVLTGSVSSNTIGVLASQAVSSNGTPVVRCALKGNPINMLAAQILGSMEDAKRISPKERAEGIKKIKIPDFNNSGDFPMELSNVVALLAENIRNYVRSTREKLAILKAEYGLENWESWQEIRDMVEGQLEQFARYNSAKIIGNGEKDTLNALHEMNSRVILLNMMRIETPQEHRRNGFVLNILRELKREYPQFQRYVQEAYKNAEDICCPWFDFDRDVAEMFSDEKPYFHEIYYNGSHLRGKTKFKDHGRLVTDFFREIKKVFGKEGCVLDISRIDEEGLNWSEHGLQQFLRKKINWGGGYKISIRVNNWGGAEGFIGKTFEGILDEMRGILEKLMVAKYIYIDSRQLSNIIDENGDSIDIYLKTADLDHAAVAKQQAQEGKIEIKSTGNIMIDDKKITISDIATPAGEMTILGCSFPKKMRQMGGAWSAIIHNSKIILSHMSSHCENEKAICFYLAKGLGIDPREAYVHARVALRLKLERGIMLVDFEPMSGEELVEYREADPESGTELTQCEKSEELVEKLRTILEELGVQTQIDKKSFNSRYPLDWWSVSYAFEKEENTDWDEEYTAEELEQGIQSERIGTLRIGDAPIQVDELTVPNGRFTVIGCANPEELNTITGTGSAILNHGELVMSCMGGGHAENDRALCYYLVKQRGMSVREAFNKAKSSIRLQLEDGKIIVDAENVTEDEMDDGLRALVAEIRICLSGAGISDIIFNNKAFCTRFRLMYMAVSDLDDADGDEDNRDEE